MLENVVGNYIDSLTEREFDAPFIALLPLLGFFDIHYLHGAFEFGKDFIAKRIENGVTKQYVFQSKAGNLALHEWSAIRGQLDMLRTDVKSHPNFDSDFPREPRLVTTGRLTGAAPIAAQSYKDHLLNLGESTFEIWDRDSLVEKLVSAPSALSTSSTSLLQALGTQGVDLNFQYLENYSRAWIRLSPDISMLRDVIEASLVAHHCRVEGRIDLACYMALMLLRAVVTTAHGQAPFSPTVRAAYTAAVTLFRNYATDLWNTCKDSFLDGDDIFLAGRTTFLSYPTKCSTIIELLSLLGLLHCVGGDAMGGEISEYLSRFIMANEGCLHPVSDRWAYALLPTGILLGTFSHISTLTHLLTQVTVWVANHYEEDIGLAGPYATIEKEATYFFGSSLEHVEAPKRSASLLATFVLDLCALLNMPKEYDIFRNEFLSVELHTPVIEAPDDCSQYCTHLNGYIHEPNAPFVPNWVEAENGIVAPHHNRPAEPYYAESIDSGWCLIAIGSVTRDRHLVRNSRELIRRLHSSKAIPPTLVATN